MGIGSVLGGIVGSVLNPGAGTAGGAFAGDYVEDLITGGGKATRCPNQPEDGQVRQMLAQLEAHEYDELNRLYSASHQGAQLPLDNPGEVAFAAFGGGDCQATSTGGRAYQAAFLKFMSKYGSSASVNPYYNANPATDPYNSDDAARYAPGAVPIAGGGSMMIVVAAVGVVALILLLRK
jgi:hypothetical protein